VIRTRSADPADVGPLRDVYLASYEDAYRDLVPADWLRSRLARHHSVDWSARLREERSRGGDVIVALADDRVVGMCQFGPTMDADDDPRAVGRIRRLYVHPRSQRQGIGRALMDVACAALRSQGFVAATLSVLAADGRRARPFYESLGWRLDQHVALAEGVASGARPEPDDVRYRKDLVE
jgi:GNAT superfamily N-acetyltransferase